MADGKSSIIVYRDWKATFDKLTDEEAGKLIKHFFSYVNDENPKSDRLIELLFEPIKQSLKRDLKKWEKICERNKINGSKGGRPTNPENPDKPTGLIGNPENPDKPDSDTDSDSDTESKYIYNKFYDLEIIESNNCQKYKSFVNFLFNTNPNFKPLNKVLSMKDQISYKSFIFYISNYSNDVIKEKILSLENTTKKTYKSFNLTLNNWLKNNSIK